MRSILVNESERNLVSVVFKRWRERGREREREREREIEKGKTDRQRDMNRE